MNAYEKAHISQVTDFFKLGVRKTAPEENCPQSRSRFGLGLALELGLEGNFPRIFKLILVLPATNASSKRSFSLLGLVKSYLRATTGQGRLNDLIILSAYKETLTN